MPRIILSLALIAITGGALTFGATKAFFSDTETSTANTFTAGAIDLKVDNESYYNGNKCTLVDGEETEETTDDVYEWVGDAPYPVEGTSCETSFGESDLDNGLLFFNFTDLKPDDEGEDTISLHVETNDAYACLDISLTSNDDNSSTEPELEVPDDEEDVDNTWDGELAQNIQMFWWADDGDNVYETGETALTDGVRSLYNLAYNAFSIPLADSLTNVWATSTPGPIPGNTTQYIAKAWCFGNLTLDPVPAGQGVDPTVDPGVNCDGTVLNNLTQTDGATLDVAFRVIQARHNESFTCNNEKPRLAKLTVIKNLVTNNGGNNIVSDFQLFVDGIVTTPVTSGVTTVLVPGNYVVYETGVEGYEANITGACNSDGEVTLVAGDDKTCTITNDDLPSNINLRRVVVNDNPAHANALLSAFKMRVDGILVPHLGSIDVTSNVAHVISQDPVPGYTATISGDAECPALLGGTATLDEGQEIECTITSDEI